MEGFSTINKKGSSRPISLGLLVALSFIFTGCEPPQLASLDSSKPPKSGSTASTNGLSNAEESPLKRQSSIYGLLVSPLPGAKHAGEASRINATVTRVGSGRGDLRAILNQKVGRMMTSSLHEVVKFQTLRNGEKIGGSLIEVGFAEKYSGKDGPSAAIAFALLIESIATNTEIDPGFAVTGDMSADGIAQPVGGIEGKIRGAIRSKCSIFAFPADNLKVLSDSAALGNIDKFINIQIFSISSFEDALAISKTKEDRAQDLNKSINSFVEVQNLLKQEEGTKWLKNHHVLEKLRQIVISTPNHQSARYLYMHGTGKAPKTLSLSGSFLQIYQLTAPLRAALDSGEIPSDTEGISETIFDLRRIRSKLDPRTRGCADALEDFSENLKKLGNTSLASAYLSVEELQSSWDKVVKEYKSIRSSPEIQEELEL